MKEIRKEQLKAAIKKAFREGRDWCRIDFGHCYQMRIDIADGMIWVDLTDENHWKVYHSDSITTLHPGNLHSVGQTVKEMEAGYLADAITKLADAGWTIK